MEVKRGSLVWWNIPDKVVATSEIVERFGLKDHEPRNDSKAALVKAVKAAKKKFGWDDGEKQNRMNPIHIKPTDSALETVWEIVKPRKDGSADTELDLIARITYDKEKRSLLVEGSDEVKSFFFENFRASATTLDSTQVARIITGTITGYSATDCAGVVMRVTGGVYFVPSDRQASLDNATEFLAKVGGKLHSCSIYSDSDGAIEDATVSEIRKELLAEITKLRGETQSLNGRSLDTRIRRIDELRAKANVHTDRLRTSYHAIESEIKILIATLEKQIPGSASAEVAFDLDAEMALIAAANRG